MVGIGIGEICAVVIFRKIMREGLLGSSALSPSDLFENGMLVMMPITLSRAFLPSVDPLTHLPDRYRIWDDIARDLPKLLAAGRARRVLSTMPLIELDELSTEREKELALGILSVFGHAAVHESWRIRSAITVPRSVARPWVAVANSLQRFPVLTYASHGLNNWRRFDEEGPIVLGNLATLRNFFGGLDEEWFVTAHVEIEAHAIPLVAAVSDARAACEVADTVALARALGVIADAIQSMLSALPRVRENCDPDIFFTRVQPFMQGMREVVYEDVEEFGNRPQNFPGGSGAQSAILPVIDAVLGIRHAKDELISYLLDLRRFMPIEHRTFLVELERGPSVRDYVLRFRDSGVNEQYNRCIEGLGDFRDLHLKMSVDYIQRPAQRMASNRGEHGTGGSPFVGYLKKHREETFSNLLEH